MREALERLAPLVAKAEKLENDGDYRGAAEIVAAALSRAHADGVKPTKPLTLVNMDSAVIPRRSYVERYKARLRVDWQKWERTSMRGIVSVAMQAASERSEGAWLGDAEEEASTPAALLVRASFSGPVTPDADEEWHAETLAKKEEAGKVELVHTCCDGTKIATSVTPFELPVKTVQAFNHDPKNTMKVLYKGDPNVENGPFYTHEQVSRWLLTANKISKNRIGEYLGRADPDAIKTLIAFLAPLDLSAFSFDEALRFFLSLFRLPGEAQQIDRIMLNFAKKYYEKHSDKFRVADTAYVLAFSLIMLNTDAHNPQIETKMSLKQFLRNNAGIDDGKNLDEDMLIHLYHNIVQNEIRMEQREYIQSMKEGWLLKQGGRIKTWRKRYTILSGNVLYYFKTPKDPSPAGFLPLEGIVCFARSDRRTFEIRPAIDNGHGLKSVRMEVEGAGWLSMFTGGNKKKPKKVKPVFTQGNHTSFCFRTLSLDDPVDAWVQAVKKHSVEDQVALAREKASEKSQKHGGGHEYGDMGRAALSFFGGKPGKAKGKKKGQA